MVRDNTNDAYSSAYALTGRLPRAVGEARGTGIRVVAPYQHTDSRGLPGPRKVAPIECQQILDRDRERLQLEAQRTPTE